MVSTCLFQGSIAKKHRNISSVVLQNQVFYDKGKCLQNGNINGNLMHCIKLRIKTKYNEEFPCQKLIFLHVYCQFLLPW